MLDEILRALHLKHDWRYLTSSENPELYAKLYALYYGDAPRSTPVIKTSAGDQIGHYREVVYCPKCGKHFKEEGAGLL